MPSITLAESAKLSNDTLIAGVIENIVTVNQSFQVMPFEGIVGNSLAYNRELALGDVEVIAVGDSITANNAATSTRVTSELTTIIGEAYINNLIQSTRSNYTDQAENQIRSKAKSVGREYQDMFINGDSGTTATDFDGLLTLATVGNTVSATATDGDALTLAKLDTAMSLVTAKDGEIDFIMMNDRELNTYFGILRAHGGVGIGEVVTLPNGAQVPTYRGTPIFRNNYIPVTQTQGGSSAASSVIMGCWDDGSMDNGIVGLTAENDFGIAVNELGRIPGKDESGWQITMYAGLACFNNNALVVVDGIVVA